MFLLSDSLRWRYQRDCQTGSRDPATNTEIHLFFRLLFLRQCHYAPQWPFCWIWLRLIYRCSYSLTGSNWFDSCYVIRINNPEPWNYFRIARGFLQHWYVLENHDDRNPIFPIVDGRLHSIRPSYERIVPVARYRAFAVRVAPNSLIRKSNWKTSPKIWCRPIQYTHWHEYLRFPLQIERMQHWLKNWLQRFPSKRAR